MATLAGVREINTSLIYFFLFPFLGENEKHRRQMDASSTPPHPSSLPTICHCQSHQAQIKSEDNDCLFSFRGEIFP